MNTVTPQWRRIVQEQLEMIASEVEQREYEAKVPHVDITKELVAGWFSDSYHAADPDFRGCFSEGELAVLAEFDRKFDASVEDLPASKGSVEAWLSSPIWRSLMRDAARTGTQIEC
ncbi:MAG: hypothetical protein Q7T69_16640 [Rhodoferax sp.]|nr:hypothetical protein [Rhodoferax sp.]